MNGELIGRVRRWWDGLWFGPGSAHDLAAARVIVGLQALWILLSRDLAGHAGLPAVFWDTVPVLLKIRFLILPGPLMLEQLLQVAAVICLVLVILGVRTRVACLLAGLLLYHLAPFETVLRRLAPMERGLDVSVLALVVLAFAPCADVWSVGRPRQAAASWWYRWPLVTVQLFVAQVYLFSGWAKLYFVGPGWVDASTIRNLILAFSQAAAAAPVHPLGAWIAGSDAVSAMVAVAALSLDFLFILAVFWKRSRLVLVPAAFLFHIGIMLTTTIYYLNWPLLLVFVDWTAVRRRIGAGRRGDQVVPSAAAA